MLLAAIGLLPCFRASKYISTPMTGSVECGSPGEARGCRGLLFHMMAARGNGRPNRGKLGVTAEHDDIALDFEAQADE